METILTIQADAARALLLCAAGPKDTRYYLQGVYVDTASNRLVSTDGHTMLLLDCPMEPCASSYAPFIIPAALLRTAIKSATKRMPSIVIGITAAAAGRRIQCTTFGPTCADAEIDGRFPEYLRVIPAKLSGEQAEYNPVFLARMQEAFTLVEGGAVQVLQVLANGKSAGVCASSGRAALGLVMPWPSDPPPFEHVLATYKALKLPAVSFSAALMEEKAA